MSTSKKTGSSSENTPPVKKVKSNKGKKEEEETPKQKLNTAESIMNRIKWDISIPKDQVIIGYLDRFVGIKQIDFVKFKGVDELEGVPLHRIRYFKLNGHIVWDRDNRIDLLTGKEVGHLVSANKITTDTLPSKSKKAKNMKYPFREQIPYYRYNDEIEQWEAITTSSHTRCSKIKNLKIINFNILFDLHETDRIFTPKRIPYILDILRDSNADIIALQEVRKSFLTQLVAQNWVQNNYFISDVTGDYTIGDHYGVVLLTRIEPNVLYLYRFSSMKTALIPVYIVIPGDGFSKENLVVPVVHLTSDLSTGPSNKRVKQLELLFNECERLEADHSIISGDFNFTDGEPEDAIINSWGKDVWLATHDIKKHPGYTYDPTNNHCAAITTHKNLQRRLDKIVVRSEKFMPQKVAILGQKAFSFVDDVSQNQIDLHPSDHYALQCELVTVQPESGFSDMKRSHSSALVIVPPRSAWKSIQKIRLASDKSAKRWPPHTKLMYPFFADEELDAVRLPLDKALTSIEPFIVKLTDFHSTEDGTIYLRATTSNADGYELHKLQDLVHKALPGCGENISEFNRLVVGQFNPDEVESKLTEFRESWTPVEFLVDQVYVLSRDSNEPFSVQYSFPLGSNPVLSAQDIPSLSDYYTKNSLLESRESQQLKRQTLDYLESLILTHFSDNEATSGLSSKDYLLKTFGSYRLGIKSGDIDVVCICTSQNPPHTAKEFLEMMKYILCEDSKVASCYAAVDALIPTLSIAFSNGVDVDLLYTNIPTTVQETEQELQKMSKTDLLAVSGIREATYLLRYVPNRKYFQALISFVKHWAKRRGLYSNALCYLGGISWAILCAYICKHHPPMDHTRPILELIKTVFDVLAKWRWQQGIALNNGTTVSQSKFKDHLPIKLTTYPYDNSTRNVTASSQQVIIRELKRASEILSRLNATNTEEILDELSSDVTTEFTSSFKAFIKFEFSSTDQESYQRWCGWVRSRFVHFAVNIEKRKFTVQIFPTIIPSSEDPVCAGELYIGVEGNISDKHEAIIQEELKKFISVVTSWVPKTENMQISATIQHQVNFNL